MRIARHFHTSTVLLGLTALLMGGCRCSEGADQTAHTGVLAADRSDEAIPLLVARRAQAGAIRVDGRLDEPSWSAAASTGPFVSSPDGKARPDSPVNAHARVLWDDQRIFFAFVVQDAAPSSPFGRDAVDPHVWEKSSAAELMIQPGDPGDNRDYYEVQVDVNGAVWDTRFDDYNQPITQGPVGGRRFGHQDWNSAVQRGITVNKQAGDYTIELAIPWAALKSTRSASPPKPGDVWRINLYSFRDGQRHALAWSPILGQGNFHKASRFGRVEFVATSSGGSS